MRLNLRTLLIMAALLALIAAATAAVMARQGRAAAPAAPSPPLTGITLQRTEFDLRQTLGRPTVVSFFASWCPSCGEEAADLAAFAAAHPEISVVGVAINDRRADAERFVMRHGIAFPVVLDSGSAVASSWGVVGIPATFFLDGRGRTVTSHVGALTRDQFEDALKTAR